MLKIAFTSDTHTRHAEMKIPECDVLVHCGDITLWGELGSIDDLMYWFDNLKNVGERILVSGNHDTNFVSKPEMTKALLNKGCHYLQDQELVIDGVTFYGMPFLDIVRDPGVQQLLIPNYESKQIDDRVEYYKSIPDYTDVLVTHHPPTMHKLSQTFDGFELGCPMLLDVVLNRVKPKVHAFGHVHTGYGMTQVDNTVFINAACGDSLNQPIVFDLQ